LKGFIKAGGKYRHKDRDVDRDTWWTSHFHINDLASAEPDEWIRTPQGKLAVGNFLDPQEDLNPWLGGRFDFSPTLDRDLIIQWGKDWRDYVFSSSGTPLYVQDPRVLLEIYTAKEDIYAGYLMTEINLGKYVMILPGVRYEETRNNYQSTYGYPFSSEDQSENINIGNLTDTTGGQIYREWLPMIHLRVKPVDWFDLRLAYTKTLSRPDYYNLVPYREVSHHETFVEQGNPGLLHTTAYNYDAFASFYNKLGMFTAGFFYKEIENIDYISTTRIQEAGDYYGYHLTEPVNAIGTSIVKGIEIELQTNFRYLPSPFDGIVLYANYARMFSQTEFPYSYTDGFESTPPFRPKVVDTIRLGRMPGQVDYVGNISLGYEKGGFSGRISLVLQGPSLQFIGTRPELDGYNGSFARWDLVLRQKFGKNWSVYFNLNNFTNYSETAFLGNTSYPTREEVFGWTADIGVRYVF
jgi:TonB-dependent receptor